MGNSLRSSHVLSEPPAGIETLRCANSTPDGTASSFDTTGRSGSRLLDLFCVLSTGLRSQPIATNRLRTMAKHRRQRMGEFIDGFKCEIEPGQRTIWGTSVNHPMKRHRGNDWNRAGTRAGICIVLLWLILVKPMTSWDRYSSSD